MAKPECLACMKEIARDTQAVEVSGGFFPGQDPSDDPLFIPEAEILPPRHLHMECLKRLLYSAAPTG